MFTLVQVVWEPYPAEILAILSDICMEGKEIWRSRVPLISWHRIEWHLPDRVLRQFGFHPQTDIQAMEQGFVRVDGRGKSSTDWFVYHQRYINMWDRRYDSIAQPEVEYVDRATAVRRYMRWYRGWASLYLLKAPLEPPTAFGARSYSDRTLVCFSKFKLFFLPLILSLVMCNTTYSGNFWDEWRHA